MRAPWALPNAHNSPLSLEPSCAFQYLVFIQPYPPHTPIKATKMPAPPAKLTSGEKAALKKVKAKENKAKSNPDLAAANKVRHQRGTLSTL